MKILVVSFNDSDNLTIENVLYELESRGHELTIFAPFRDSDSIRMFEGLHASIMPIQSLTPKAAKEFDVAFCSNMTMRYMYLLDIYCFVYTSYYNEVFMTDGADFLFTYRKGCMPRCNYRCATMQVGDPKNDKMICKPVQNSKRILYIDSGHMPFGRTGKIQIADMILDICNQFPDYELCIKPRWLREKTTNYTHRNIEHIYDIIEERCQGDIPDNLNMLEQHYDLQELIDSSISVITLYTGAVLNVVLQEKGLIVVSGWDNEDKWDIRNKIEIEKKNLLFGESGCVVDYRDVNRYLPDGILANTAFSDKMFCYKTGASAKIADVMEYVYNKFLSRNCFPDIGEYNYETYTVEIKSGYNISMRTLKQERLRDILQQRIALLSYRITAQIDFSDYYLTLERTYKDCKLTKSECENYFNQFAKIQKKLLISQSKLLSDDSINQSFLLQALYDLGQENKILALPVETILCSSAYNYYLGMIYKKNGETFEALNAFLNFLKEANARTFCKYPQEEDWGIKNAYNYIFSAYDGENIPAEDFADIYCDLYEHRDWVIVNYNNRKRAHNLLPKAADVLVDSDPIRALKCLQLYTKYEYHYNIREREQRIRSLIQDMNVLRSAKLFRLKEKVKLLFKKMKGGVKCYREHGLKYTLNRVREKAKSKFGQHAVFRIWDIFTNKVLNGYRLYAGVMQKYGENTRLLLSAPAMGDVYIFSSLFYAYLDLNCPRKDAVFGVYGEGGNTISSMFGIKQVEAFNIQEIHYLYNLIMFCSPSTVSLESLHYHVFYRHTAILAYLEGLHQFNLFSLNQAYLDVLDQPVSKPKFLYDEELINDQFREKKLQKGKTVVLSPYAKSVKRIPIPFWNALSDRLRREGFSVCTNSASEAELPIAGTLPVSFPMDKSVPFLENAGTSIGLRSGFLDVISSADCLKISLCHQEAWKRGLIYKDYESYNLSQMYHQPNQYDLLYSPETEDTLIDEIVQMVTTYTQENGNR